jgi:predicted nucleic acid-binding protein
MTSPLMLQSGSTSTCIAAFHERDKRRLPNGSVRAFVDSSALVALSVLPDINAARAKRIVRERRDIEGFVGTTAILTEFHSYILYRRGIEYARRAITALMIDPLHRWLPVSPELVEAAMQNWIARYSDQKFSLVDAISFETMRRERITHAFTFDRHFLTAGFLPLT